MNFGQVVQFISLLVGLASFVAFIAHIINKDSNSFKIAKGLMLVQAALVTITVFILIVALVAGDYRYVYVASYTDRALPFIYKLTALWAGQAGSLLFWTWLVALFAAIELWRIRDRASDYQSYVFAVVVFTATYFMFLCTAVTPVFEMLAFTPRDGNGLNPMLQNPGMVIHPPLLYIGFVGFLIPFGHALASSCKRDVTNYWVKTSRVWSLITWVFLTAGIVLGAWWAYVELGWGGYWAWDPVENASLFPWITATALLHAGIIYERKGRLKGWTYALILITYQLTIFGTFLTRSGVMSDSVHSFGESPLAIYFPAYMIITGAIFLIAMYSNRKSLADNEDFNFGSREGAFFIAMLCFVALTIALIFYTMLPVISQNLWGSKISVQIGSYNLVSIPFFAVIFLLASFGPILPYGKAVLAKFMKGYAVVFVLALAATVVAAVMGFNYIAAMILTLTAAASLFSFLFHGFKLIKASGLKAITTHRRSFGAVIVHIGLALMAFGVIYSAFYSTEADFVASPGENVQFGRYTVNVGEIGHEEGANWHADYAPLDISVGDKYLTSLYPEMRLYTSRQEDYFADVAYYSLARGDIYSILQGYDTEQNIVRISLIFQPLIIWIWVGCILMCIGATYGATSRNT